MSIKGNPTKKNLDIVLESIKSANLELCSIQMSHNCIGNLLKKELQAHHVARAFLALSKSERTTGHVMTVDGGNIEASLR